MDWLKNLWNWLVGKAKALLACVLDEVIEQAKEIAEEKELAGLALDAVQAAAAECLKGEEAWTAARARFVKALKDAGQELTDTAIDTILQNVYSAWKRLGKPEATKNHATHARRPQGRPPISESANQPISRELPKGGRAP